MSVSRKQMAALVALGESPAVSTFRMSGAYRIQGRVAKALIDRGLAQYSESTHVDLGGGFSICGRVVEITDAGLSWLKERGFEMGVK